MCVAGDAAFAQAPRTTISASVSAGAAYDDNIFFSAQPDRQAGAVLRLDPSLQVNWQGSPGRSAFASYSFGSEVYPDYPELSQAIARQRGTAGLRARHKHTSFGASIALDHTQTPSELFDEVGLQLGRQSARAFSAVTSLEQGVTREGSLGIQYAFRYLDYENGQDAGSHLVTLGFTQHWRKANTFAIRAGPRVTDGEVSVDVNAGLTRRLRAGTASLSYSRSRYVTPTKSLDVDTVAAAADRQVGRSGVIGGFVNFFRSWRDEDDVRGMRGTVWAARRLHRGVFVRAAYEHSRQTQAMGEVFLPGGGFTSRNVFYAGITLLKQPPEAEGGMASMPPLRRRKE